MVTYVNDLRLSELATGEGSGTWGTTTNTNLELIGEALGYGTEQSFSSDADATTTIGDGVSDPARAMYFKVTSAGSLTATRTLTIAPNTVSRVMFIENATTGSQSIAISQGSGANVTIAAGKTAVVYLDGAGATAAVVDAMALVDPGVTDTLAEVLVAGNTSGGTGLTMSSGDDLTLTGASYNAVWDSSDSALEFADNAKAVFGAGSDLSIYHSGSHSFISEAGTGDLYIGASNNIALMNAAFSENKLLATTDGALTLYHNGSAKLATTAGGVDITGTADAESGVTVTHSRSGVGYTLLLNNTNNGANKGSGIKWQGGGFDTAAIIGRSDATAASADAPGYLTFHTSADGSEDLDERLRITSDGSVGIGTSTATSIPGFTRAVKLEDSTSASYVVSGGANEADFGISSNGGWIGTSTNVPMRFASNGNEGFRIDSNGQILQGISVVPTGVLLGRQFVSSSATGAEIIAFREDTSVTVGDKAGAFLIGNSDTDGAEDHFVGMWGKVSSTNGSQDLNFAAGRSGYEGDSPQLTLDSSGNILQQGGSPEYHFGTTSASHYNWRIAAQENVDAGFEISSGTQSAGSGASSDTYTTRFLVKADTGNVGIGVTDPTQPLVIQASSGAAAIALNGRTSDGISTLSFYANDGTTSQGYVQGRSDSLRVWTASGDFLSFGSGGSESARFDSSGNLLVSQTVANGVGGTPADINGSELSKGYLNLNRDDTAHATQIQFGKNGTVAGRIHTDDRLSIGTGSTGIYFYNSGNSILPYDNSAATPASRDAAIDLGSSGARFKDLYLSGGVQNITASGVATGTLISAISGVTNGFQISANTSNEMTYDFNTGAGLKMRLTNDGNLLVGLTSISDATSRSYGNAFSGTSSNPNWKSWGSGSHTHAQFRNGTSVVGSITSTSSATAYNTSSDQRLKENIVDAPSASDDIDAIQVRSFDWKADGSHQKYGMVAQELQSVAPEAVSGDADSEEMMGVDYSKLVPMMLKEIQSLRARVAQLES